MDENENVKQAISGLDLHIRATVFEAAGFEADEFQRTVIGLLEQGRASGKFEQEGAHGFVTGFDLCAPAVHVVIAREPGENGEVQTMKGASMHAGRAFEIATAAAEQIAADMLRRVSGDADFRIREQRTHPSNLPVLTIEHDDVVVGMVQIFQSTLT
ncbi:MULTISPECIES: hypothetical protein [Herbaspirillum]|uniref:Uncharacterized protein n=2 Tax=Herbaspirillum huttiense TaxID=863372 RepID=A0AAJ2HC62_9BURK|nr:MULTISPECIES: hypothetical protein [Herbaspirillum]MDR9836833.1 hypothetical protein [Herbaspirillum huttiense]